MSDGDNQQKPPGELRRRAEKLLRQRLHGALDVSPGDIRNLIHELQVHQIELEMQNEELRRTQVELEEARQRYYDLYDLAPVGYFGIDRRGLFCEVNLSGADLLGVERRYLIGEQFARFVAPDNQDSFYFHRKRIFEEGHSKHTCELKLVKKDGTPFYGQLESTAVEDGGGNFNGFRTTVTDITERKLAEGALQEAHDNLDRKVRERTAELAKANEQLQKEIAERKGAEDEMRCLSAKLLSIQEEERGRIARELHDGTGQILSAIKYKLEGILGQLHKEKADEAIESCSSAILVIQDAMEEVRRIYMDLRPSLLDDLGILATLGWFCREFQNIYPDISVDKAINIKEGEVPEDTKIHVYRLLQEALNNAAKHSEADQVLVSLKKKDDTLELAVEDNGRGFDSEKVLSLESAKGGSGIGSMRERADLSGGYFSIESTTGKGTVVRASWPSSVSEKF